MCLAHGCILEPRLLSKTRRVGPGQNELSQFTDFIFLKQLVTSQLLIVFYQIPLYTSQVSRVRESRGDGGDDVCCLWWGGWWWWLGGCGCWTQLTRLAQCAPATVLTPFREFSSDSYETWEAGLVMTCPGSWAKCTRERAEVICVWEVEKEVDLTVH